MPRHQYKNPNTNSQDNVLTPEASNPETWDIAEAQDTDVRTAFMSKFKDYNQHVDRHLSEVYGKHKHRDEMTKTVQGVRVETESLKKTQTEKIDGQK